MSKCKSKRKSLQVDESFRKIKTHIFNWATRLLYIFYCFIAFIVLLYFCTAPLSPGNGRPIRYSGDGYNDDDDDDDDEISNMLLHVEPTNQSASIGDCGRKSTPNFAFFDPRPKFLRSHNLEENSMRRKKPLFLWRVDGHLQSISETVGSGARRFTQWRGSDSAAGTVEQQVSVARRCTGRVSSDHHRDTDILYDWTVRGQGHPRRRGWRRRWRFRITDARSSFSLLHGSLHCGFGLLLLPLIM